MSFKYLITGGTGFIGSNFIDCILKNSKDDILNLDCHTYAANITNEQKWLQNKKYKHVKLDICQTFELKKIVLDYKPDYIINFAAESHVDSSILNPEIFLKTNVFGCMSMLQLTRELMKDTYYQNHSKFRFHHISTDEVYGESLSPEHRFNELSPYRPSSPYAASKASADHLVHSWARTYKIPYLITYSSNNFGPYQYKEKLIPKVIECALRNKKIPIYGSGKQFRDWLYVEDHVNAIIKLSQSNIFNSTYNVSSNNIKTNLELVYFLCDILDHEKTSVSKDCKSYRELIDFVEDRPGHDFGYSLDTSKIEKDLNWNAQSDFEKSLHTTVMHYLSHFS